MQTDLCALSRRSRNQMALRKHVPHVAMGWYSAIPITPEERDALFSSPIRLFCPGRPQRL